MYFAPARKKKKKKVKKGKNKVDKVGKSGCPEKSGEKWGQIGWAEIRDPPDHPKNHDNKLYVKKWEKLKSGKSANKSW